MAASTSSYLTSLFGLTNKTTLITGAARGIGRGLALYLANAGSSLILLVRDPSAEGVKSLSSEVQSLGLSCIAYKYDLSDRDALLSIVHKICEEDGHKIDIFVHCAGIQHRSPAHEFPTEQWDSIISTNLSAGFLLARDLAKYWFENELKHPTGSPPDFLLQGHRKKVVFMASVLTFTGSAQVPAYVASKGAVGQLTKALNNEWMSRGVNVNAIAPGYIHTELTSGLRDGGDKEKLLMSRVPAGRWGVPEDLSGAIIHLCGRSGDYVGGEIHVVDGGFTGR